MAQWFCVVGGRQYGPVDEAEFRQWIHAGRVQPTDLVWREGMDQWLPGGSIGELFPAGSQASPLAAAPTRVAQGPYQQPYAQSAPAGTCYGGIVDDGRVLQGWGLGLVCFGLICCVLATVAGLIFSIMGIARAKKVGAGYGVGLAGIIVGGIVLMINSVIVVMWFLEAYL